MTTTELIQLGNAVDLQEKLSIPVAAKEVAPGKILKECILDGAGHKLILVGNFGTPKSEAEESIAFLVDEAKKFIKDGGILELDSAELVWYSTNTLHVNADQSEGAFRLRMTAQTDAPAPQVDFERRAALENFIHSALRLLNEHAAAEFGAACASSWDKDLAQVLEWGAEHAFLGGRKSILFPEVFREMVVLDIDSLCQKEGDLLQAAIEAISPLRDRVRKITAGKLVERVFFNALPHRDRTLTITLEITLKTTTAS